MSILICPECGEEYDDRLRCFTCDVLLELGPIRLSKEQVAIVESYDPANDPNDLNNYEPMFGEYTEYYQSLDDGEEDPDLEDPDIED
jgi:hypothetical protein